MIELNKRIVSENDSILVASTAKGPAGLGRDMGFGTIFSGAAQYGDYDHCINALRQLQRRVTVCLIYDPKKQHLKKGK